MGNVDRTTPDLISTADARAILGMSTSSISRAVKAGDITPAVRLPGLRGAMLFDRAVIEAWAAKRAERVS